MERTHVLFCSAAKVIFSGLGRGLESFGKYKYQEYRNGQNRILLIKIGRASNSRLRETDMPSASEPNLRWAGFLTVHADSPDRSSPAFP